MARTRAEIGAVGLPIFSGYLQLETDSKLRGAEGVRTFREMRLNEPACAALIAASYQLLRTDLGVEPGGTTDNDKRAGEFLESCLDDMRENIGVYLRQMYSMLWAGWDIHEIVYKRRNGGNGSRYNDGKVSWAAWELRRQESLYRWGLDKNGKVDTFKQRPAPTFDLRELPLAKRCIHLVADDTEGSPEGLSVLRAGYRQWYFVKNLELLMGITLERFGTGIPVFEIQPGTPSLSEPDLLSIQTTAEQIRQNERAYIITPAGVKFYFAPSPGLTSADYRQTIEFMRNWILASVLADFIALGLGQRGGAYALGKDKTELFLLALNSFQDRLAGALNRQAVPWLFRYNDFGTLSDLPRLTLPAIKRYDLAMIGGFLSAIEKIGAFHVTPEDEAHLRKIADMPDIDSATLEELHAADEVDDATMDDGDASAEHAPGEMTTGGDANQIVGADIVGTDASEVGIAEVVGA
jgi:hypothetical protein